MWNPFRRRRRPAPSNPTTSTVPLPTQPVDGPTLFTTAVAPLLTPGQQTRTCGDMR